MLSFLLIYKFLLFKMTQIISHVNNNSSKELYNTSHGPGTVLRI